MTHRVIMEACLNHRLMPKAFFDPALRFGKVVVVRAEVIRTMREMGMSYSVIGRLCRRDTSTVRYWLHEKHRERRRANNRRRWAERATGA